MINKTGGNEEMKNILNDSRTRFVLLAVTFLFSILTAAAVWQNGFLGIFEYQFKNFGGLQVLIDLVIALSFFMVWMWNAKSMALDHSDTDCRFIRSPVLSDFQKAGSGRQRRLKNE